MITIVATAELITAQQRQAEADLKALVEQGVIVAQCANTMRERNISRDQIYDFMAVVPSGNGELIIRQGEGWAIVKP